MFLLDSNVCLHLLRGKGAAEIRAVPEAKGQSIGPLDILIAATARARDWTLITGNIREFDRVENLKAENRQE